MSLAHKTFESPVGKPKLVATTALVIFASAVFLSTGAVSAPQNVYTQDMDRSIKPGDDFYRYANGVGSER